MNIRTLLLAILLSVGAFFPAYGNSIDGVRVWPAPENTRIVFDLSNKPDYKYFSLKNPQRLVIDFKNSKNLVSFKNVLKTDKRIKRIRTSKSKTKGTTRLVLELANNYSLAVFPLAPAGQYGNRLVIDLFDQEKITQRTHTPKNTLGWHQGGTRVVLGWY